MQTGIETHRLDSRLNRSFWTLCLLASLSLAVAVVLGAFFAHRLEGKLDADALEVMATGNRYHFYFSLAIILAALLWKHSEQKLFLTASWLFLAGVLCFSGSLYFLSIRDLIGMQLTWLGPVTPIGGLLFIAGCVSMCIGCIRLLKQ